MQIISSRVNCNIGYFSKHFRVPRSRHVDEHWLPVEPGKTRYLKINSRSTLVEEEMPFASRLPFWDRMKIQNRLVSARDEF
jgi:hypothetical protein